MESEFTIKLIPPFRYAVVEESLFRGSYPTEKNCRFLRRLKLKTMISLTPKKPSKVIIGFCEEQDIALKHLSVPKFKDDVTVSSSQVVQILQMIIDPANLPLYIHCLDGANVTGIVIMCLRKLQNWNLSVIFTEFSRFTRANYISSVESEFVETFKAEVEIGAVIPPWLWQGVRMSKHPTLKLKLVGGLAKGELSPRKDKKKKNENIKNQLENGSFVPPNDLFISRDLQALSLEGLVTSTNTTSDTV